MERDRIQVPVPERLAAGARTARERGREIGRAAKLDVPWARCRPARWVREGIHSLVLGPVIDLYCRRRSQGHDAFDGLESPVVFVANHSSHLDTPTILEALPYRWRQRTAVAAAADYFYRNRLVASIVSLVFNTVPIERKGGGLRDAKGYLDHLLRQRWNLLLFPEGTRSRSGEVGRIRSGAAVIAAEHGLAIVPIHVEGTNKAMPPGRAWPKRLRLVRRHKVTVQFGAPIRARPGEAAPEMAARVRAFFAEHEQAHDDVDAPPSTPVAAGDPSSVA